MTAKVLLLAGVLLVSGCASFTGPPRPPEAVLENGRVGIVLKMPEQVVHTHIGTTVFNNFSREYDFDLNLTKDFERQLSDNLVKAGLEPVAIENSALAEFDGHVVGLRDSIWYIKNEAESVAGIRTEYRLDALIRVWPIGRHMVAMECSSMGCNERYAEGPGLYTRGIFGLLQSMAVPGVAFEVILFEPVFELSSYKPLRTVKGFGLNATVIDDFSRPDDLKKLSDAELRAVRDAITVRLETLAEAIASGLTSAPE